MLEVRANRMTMVDSVAAAVAGLTVEPAEKAAVALAERLAAEIDALVPGSEPSALERLSARLLAVLVELCATPRSAPGRQALVQDDSSLTLLRNDSA